MSRRQSRSIESEALRNERFNFKSKLSQCKGNTDMINRRIEKLEKNKKSNLVGCAVQLKRLASENKALIKEYDALTKINVQTGTYYSQYMLSEYVSQLERRCVKPQQGIIRQLAKIEAEVLEKTGPSKPHRVNTSHNSSYRGPFCWNNYEARLFLRELNTPPPSSSYQAGQNEHDAVGRCERM